MNKAKGSRLKAKGFASRLNILEFSLFNVYDDCKLCAVRSFPQSLFKISGTGVQFV